MIVVALVLVGLVFGSFVNALVWRVYEQEREQAKKKPNKDYLNKLSVARGRSMCPDCKHELAAKDLIPVLSWLSTGGKCRYCHKPISTQYPIVELVTAAVFVASYIWWPKDFDGLQAAIFVTWLLILTGLMALLVYDARWKLLPNRIMYPLGGLASIQGLLSVIAADRPLRAFLGLVLGVLVGGGIFYGLFQVSKGKWIGGGDVKLGWLLGLVVGTPAGAILFIFVASLLGTLFSLPLMVTHRLKRSSAIPFGPFLIGGAFVALLFGGDIFAWYKDNFINF